MSQDNVESFKRSIEANNRRDIDALVAEMHPEVEWHPAMAAFLGGQATLYRGRDGVREALQDLYGSFAELHLEISEIRDLGDRLFAMGRMRGRGSGSGAEIESPWAYLVHYRDGKATSVRAYLDPNAALEALEREQTRSH